MSRLKTYKFGVYGGVDKKIAPDKLPDDTSPSMDNFVLRPTGPEKVQGWSLYTSQQLTDGKASPTVSKILHFRQFKKSDGSIKILAFTDTVGYFFRTSTSTWIPFTRGNNATTSVNADSASGAKNLFVVSTAGYAAGDGILINEGGARQEAAIVSSLASGPTKIVTVANLTFTHTAAQADAVRRTYEAARVNVDSASGQKVLKVDFTGQFTVGEKVLINIGGAREEYATIASIQAGVSLTMVANLSFTHTAAQNDKVYRIAELNYQNGTATGVDSDVTGDIVYFTTFVDNVQEWNGTDTFSKDVSNLDQAEGLAGGTRVRCRYLRNFQGFLILAHLSEGGTTLPTKIRWSRLNDFETWKNNTDGSGQAGYATFVSPDFINGMRQNKQEMMFYRDNSIEGASYISVPDIFSFRRVSGQGEQAVGLIGSDAIDDLSDFHAFLGQDNLWVNNAISQSKLGDSIRDDLFNRINPTNRGFCKVFWDRNHDEILVAFPSQASSLCDMGYIFSLQLQKWSGPRDLSATAFGRYQVTSDTTWNNSSGAWDDQTARWDDIASLSNSPIVMMGSNDGFIYVYEGSTDKNGTPISASYRTKISDLGLPEIMKRVEKVYIGMRQDGDYTVDAYVGTANFPGETISWQGPFSLSVNEGAEPFVYPDLTARYFQIRIDTTKNANVREIEAFFIPGKFK